MAHFSGLVAAGVHPNPCDYADIVTSTTHKTLRGPRSGMILAKEKYGAAIDKTVFPGVQGGPLVHIIAAKAVCFREAATPEFVAYQQAGGGQCADARRRPGGRRIPRRLRRHRHAPDAGGRVREGRSRQGSRSRRSIAPTSPPTRTRFRSMRIRRSIPAACASEARPLPRADSARAEMREVAALIARVLENIAERRASRPRCGVACAALTERFPLYAWKLTPPLPVSRVAQRSDGARCRCISSSTSGGSATSASAPTSAT